MRIGFGMMEWKIICLCMLMKCTIICWTEMQDQNGAVSLPILPTLYLRHHNQSMWMDIQYGRPMILPATREKTLWLGRYLHVTTMTKIIIQVEIGI